MKQPRYIVIAVISILALAYAQEGGMEIIQGSGPPLDLSRLTPIYQETFEASKTPAAAMLQNTLFFGTIAPWSAALVDGSYQLTNSTDSGIVQYFRIAQANEFSGPASSHAVSVDIKAEFTKGFSAAGLVFRIEMERDNYYAFTLENEIFYAIYWHDAEGVKEILAASSEVIKPGTNTLTIVPNGSEMTFYVNGAWVARIDDPNMAGKGVGIFAGGTGTFQFDNFTIYQTSSPEVAGASEADTPPETTTPPSFTTYQDPQQLFSLEHPADWQIEADADGVGLLADEDTLFAVVPGQQLTPADMAYYSSLSLDKLADMLVETFQQDAADFQVSHTSDLTVGDFPAKALDFSATDPGTQTSVTGRMVFFLSDDHLFILVASSDVSSYPQYQPIFERMFASFRLGASTQNDSQVDTARPSQAPFAGTFRDDQLTLTLQGDGGQYSGQIVFNDQTFPVTAQGSDIELSGVFKSGGNTFAFTTTLDGDTLTLITGGATYVLQKEALNPLAQP